MERTGIVFGALVLILASAAVARAEALDASETYELFIDTEPAGAALVVNGNPVGESPVLLKKIPYGRLVVEAAKNGLYGCHETTVSSGGLIKITITLSRRYGRVFVEAPDRALEVYLDDTYLGRVAQGLFEDIATGTYLLRVQGEAGRTEREITVLPEETTVVEITLKDLAVPSPDEEGIAGAEAVDAMPESEQAYRRLTAERDALEESLRIAAAKHRRLTVAGLSFFGLGGALTVGTVAAASYSGGASLGLGIAGALSYTVGVMVLAERPDLEEMQLQWERIIERIEAFPKGAAEK
jgi:hypothetical protein